MLFAKERSTPGVITSCFRSFSLTPVVSTRVINSSNKINDFAILWKTNATRVFRVSLKTIFVLANDRAIKLYGGVIIRVINYSTSLDPFYIRDLRKYEEGTLHRRITYLSIDLSIGELLRSGRHLCDVISMIHWWHETSSRRRTKGARSESEKKEKT